MIRIRVQASLQCHRRRRRKARLCLVLLKLDIVGKNLDASSCKVDYIVIVISHLDVLQTLSIVLGMSRANK